MTNHAPSQRRQRFARLVLQPRRMAGVLLLLLVMPAAAQAARVVTWDTTSRFVDPSAVAPGRSVDGRSLSRLPGLRVNVMLPDGYDGRRRFPVLYLLHGAGEGYDWWASPQRGRLLEVAGDLPAIVVMPEGAIGFYANWWNGGLRGRSAWERYHLDELIPLVERRLRVRRGRRWHAIAGFSMGGLGGVFYASQRPGYFGSAISLSAPLSLRDPLFPMVMDLHGVSHQAVYGEPGSRGGALLDAR